MVRSCSVMDLLVVALPMVPCLTDLLAICGMGGPSVRGAAAGALPRLLPASLSLASAPLRRRGPRLQRSVGLGAAGASRFVAWPCAICRAALRRRYRAPPRWCAADALWPAAHGWPGPLPLHHLFLQPHTQSRLMDFELAAPLWPTSSTCGTRQLYLCLRHLHNLEDHYDMAEFVVMVHSSLGFSPQAPREPSGPAFFSFLR